jgi:hypothetical protein
MTRLQLNPDGTCTLQSWSYFGPGNADEEGRRFYAEFQERNRKAKAEWDKLTPEEQLRRTEQFHIDNPEPPAKETSSKVPRDRPADVDGELPTFI